LLRQDGLSDSCDFAELILQVAPCASRVPRYAIFAVFSVAS
jgi:hypothetical protein